MNDIFLNFRAYARNTPGNPKTPSIPEYVGRGTQSTRNTQSVGYEVLWIDKINPQNDLNT